METGFPHKEAGLAQSESLGRSPGLLSLIRGRHIQSVRGTGERAFHRGSLRELLALKPTEWPGGGWGGGQGAVNEGLCMPR